MSYLTAFQDGVLAAKAGKRIIARLQFEQVLQLEPEFVPCLLWLAWTSESPAQASEYLEQARKLSPNDRLVNSYFEVVQVFGNSTWEANSYPTGNSSTASTAVEEALTSDKLGELQTHAPTDVENASATDKNESSEPSEQEKRNAPNTSQSEAAGDETERKPEDEPTLVFDSSEDTVAISEIRKFRPGEALPAGSDNLEPGLPDEDTGTEDADEGEQTAALQADQSPVSVTTDSHDAEGPSNGISVEEMEQADQQGDASDQAANSSDEQANDEIEILGEVNNLQQDVAKTVVPPAEAKAKQDPLRQREVQQANEARDPEGKTPPADKAETAATSATTAKSSGRPAPRILAVDDSPTVRKLVSMTLESAGYQVETAEDGVEAMKVLARMTPHLILLDVNMPRMDGYKLCKLLKRHDRTKFIPVVMLSGKDGMFDKLRGTLVGCDDYISKPFRSQDLLNHIERYINTLV